MVQSPFYYCTQKQEKNLEYFCIPRKSVCIKVFPTLTLNFVCNSELLQRKTQISPSMVSPADRGLAHLSVPVGEGRGLIRWAMLSGMFMVSGAIWGWTGFTGDSGTFLRSFLSVDSAVNVIFILVLGNRKQHLGTGVKREHIGSTLASTETTVCM